MNPRILSSRLALAASAGVLAVAVPAHADLTLNFFGDVNYEVEHAEETSNTFKAATLDLFANQTEGKFSFIGEMIIEAFGSNNFNQDIDRLEVMYRPTEWLRLRAGRLRSAFGYYGDAFQNGRYFMTPVGPPLAYEGEGIEGIVPSHSIGLHVDVTYPLGDERGKLTLDTEVLNGRGVGLDDIPVFEDNNNGKAVNLRLRYVGEGRLEGLVIGGNVYIDDIPENNDEASELDETRELDHPAIHELVLNGHAAYVADGIHLIGEVSWFRHREHGAEMSTQVLALYGEAGYTFGDVTPYARFESVRYSDENIYFTASGIPSEEVRQLSTGARYAASASVAVKLEGGLDLQESHAHVIAQAAFAF
jgi:hypothetical protein